MTSPPPARSPPTDSYTFDLDGRAYAQKLARIAQEQMMRKGQLPPGASVEVPEHLANITGSGELWVDGRGLPVREKVTMAIPAAPGADNRSETQMDIRFTGYKGYQEQLAAAPWLGSLAGRLAAPIGRPPPSGVRPRLFGMALVGAVVVARPGRRTRFIVTIAGWSPSLSPRAAGQRHDPGRDRAERRVGEPGRRGGALHRTAGIR